MQDSREAVLLTCPLSVRGCTGGGYLTEQMSG